MCVVLLLFRPEVWRSVLFLFFRLHIYISVYHMTWVCFGFKILILKRFFFLYPCVFHTIVGFSFLFGATFTLSFFKVCCVRCFCWPQEDWFNIICLSSCWLSSWSCVPIHRSPLKTTVKWPEESVCTVGCSASLTVRPVGWCWWSRRWLLERGGLRGCAFEPCLNWRSFMLHLTGRETPAYLLMLHSLRALFMNPAQTACGHTEKCCADSAVGSPAPLRLEWAN